MMRNYTQQEHTDLQLILGLSLSGKRIARVQNTFYRLWELNFFGFYK